jgi:hypothetical protein
MTVIWRETQMTPHQQFQLPVVSQESETIICFASLETNNIHITFVHTVITTLFHHELLLLISYCA